jgi:hypothetical protein
MKTAPSITTPKDKTVIGTVASRHVTNVGTPTPSNYDQHISSVFLAEYLACRQRNNTQHSDHPK